MELLHEVNKLETLTRNIQKQYNKNGSLSRLQSLQDLYGCFSVGKFAWMAEGRLPKIALKWMPKQKTARGRPKKNWMESIRKAMNERNLNEGQWEDRKQWSLGVGQRRKKSWNRYIYIHIYIYTYIYTYTQILYMIGYLQDNGWNSILTN